MKDAIKLFHIYVDVTFNASTWIFSYRNIFNTHLISVHLNRFIRFKPLPMFSIHLFLRSSLISLTPFVHKTVLGNGQSLIVYSSFVSERKRETNTTSNVSVAIHGYGYDYTTLNKRNSIRIFSMELLHLSHILIHF